MQKRIFLSLGLIVILTTSLFSQTNNFQNPQAVKILGANGGYDPLGILEDDDSEETRPASKTMVVANLSSAERTAFNLINQKRAESGLRLLVWNDDVASVARVHSQNMAEFSFFGHRGLDSKLVSDRADANGVRKWRAIGENIAFNRGYDDPITKAVDQWLNSPEHKRNMMDTTWKESAVGVAVAADGSYYFTQVFLARK